MTVCIATTVLLFMACTPAAAQAFENRTQMYLDRAKEYCESSDPPEVCDWVDNINDAREAFVFYTTVPFGGTVWTGWYDSAIGKERFPPRNVSGHFSYWQYLGRGLSLGCRGPIRVIAVLKKTGGREEACVQLSGENLNSDNITRCELILPETYENEDEAAINAQETNCVTCSQCGGPGECPSEMGVWYKDIWEFDMPEKCPPFDGPSIPAIVIDPGAEFRLAKFDVESIED